MREVVKHKYRCENRRTLKKRSVNVARKTFILRNQFLPKNKKTYLGMLSSLWNTSEGHRKYSYRLKRTSGLFRSTSKLVKPAGKFK